MIARLFFFLFFEWSLPFFYGLSLLLSPIKIVKKVSRKTSKKEEEEESPRRRRFFFRLSRALRYPQQKEGLDDLRTSANPNVQEPLVRKLLDTQAPSIACVLSVSTFIACSLSLELFLALALRDNGTRRRRLLHLAPETTTTAAAAQFHLENSMHDLRLWDFGGGCNWDGYGYDLCLVRSTIGRRICSFLSLSLDVSWFGKWAIFPFQTKIAFRRAFLSSSSS